ncbi:trypsin-like peptidase domain-containing protein [Pseudolysinimonas sp.]|uniref:S1C family serine protease n=1 Tax=Pseudolysinimonas sp. TaxID=2680009 RepID=UPI003267ECE4
MSESQPESHPETAPSATPSTALEAPYSHLPAATPPSATPKQRSTVGPIIAALAVGALVGGASGAGVAVWAVSSSGTATQSGTMTPQTVTIDNTHDLTAVNAVAAKASPSVVTISVTASSEGGTGSGVVLSADGYVLTNNHVVTLDGASSTGTIEVTTADGHIYKATIVGTDPIVDLAVIKLTDASGLTPMEFGDPESLKVGDQVIAIGAPLGLSNTVTDGIVSALDRSISIASSAVPSDGSPTDSGSSPFNFGFPGGTSSSSSSSISLPVIQTDAAINPGNSGGALLSDQGKLVGINVAIASTGSASASTQSGSIGVGFAIPSDLAKRVADEIIATGSATHGLLGATVRDATSADGSLLGAVIDSVTADSAAANAGIKAGDVVTEFNGAPIANRTDITAAVRALAGGASAKLTYVRGGSPQTVTVTLGTFH